MSNYLISISKNESVNNGVIHDVRNKLKVKAFNLIKSKFTPSKGEVQYFVTAGKKTIAFETQGFKKHRQLIVLQMIATYCVYLGLIGAQIHSSLPY